MVLSVCCSVLQCVAVCCNALQCVAVCCSVLPCIAVCFNLLQRVTACCSVLQRFAACCSVLQRVAACCGVLKFAACRSEIYNMYRGGICIPVCTIHHMHWRGDIHTCSHRLGGGSTGGAICMYAYACRFKICRSVICGNSDACVTLCVCVCEKVSLWNCVPVSVSLFLYVGLCLFFCSVFLCVCLL